MFHIGPVGAARDALAVQEQLKTFIGTDVNSHRRGGRFKLSAKTQNNRLLPPAGKVVSMLRGRNPKIRMPDPRGVVNGLDRYNSRVAGV